MTNLASVIPDVDVLMIQLVRHLSTIVSANGQIQAGVYPSTLLLWMVTYWLHPEQPHSSIDMVVLQLEACCYAISTSILPIRHQSLDCFTMGRYQLLMIWILVPLLIIILMDIGQSYVPTDMMMISRQDVLDLTRIQLVNMVARG